MSTDQPDIRHEQPAPTAREIPADELTEVELWRSASWGVIEPDGSGAWRTVENGMYVGEFPSDAVRLVPAALLDERGRERDAARAEVERLRGLDEKTKAVVQAAQVLLNALSEDDGYDHGFNSDATERAVRALSAALARAHEDGGQDR